MKKIFLLLLLVSQLLFSQDSISKKSFKFKISSSVYVLFPKHFGENFLAKANKSNFGIGTNICIFEYHNFKPCFGFERIYYSVTDITKAGNINSSNYSSFYGNIIYKVPVTKELSFHPFIGLGSSALYFKSSGRDFGHQNGINYRLGIATDYQFNRFFTMFLSANYVQSKYNINTTPEFIDYYRQSKQVQFTIGIKVN